MNPRALYKHKNGRDCAICVAWSLYIPQKKGWKVKFYWVNIRSKNLDILTPIIHDFFDKEYCREWKVWKDE